MCVAVGGELLFIVQRRIYFILIQSRCREKRMLQAKQAALRRRHHTTPSAGLHNALTEVPTKPDRIFKAGRLQERGPVGATTHCVLVFTPTAVAAQRMS